MKKYYFILILYVFYACDNKSEQVVSSFSYWPMSNLRINDTITFSNCSDNSIKCKWAFGDSTFSSDNNPIHSYKYPGTYVVQLTIHNEGVMDSISEVLIINDRPQACFNFSPNDFSKVGDTINFFNCSQNSSHFLWDFGDENTSNEKEPNHVYSNTGSYKVQLFALDGISTDSLSTEIIIHQPDDIIYKIFNPTINVFTIRNLTSDANCSLPIPRDSVSLLWFDVNNDFVNDFGINARHYMIPGNCGRCGNIYVEEMKMEGFICAKEGDGPVAKYFHLTEIISNKLKWSSTSYLMLWSCQPLPFVERVENGYLGIKINNNYGWIRVSKYKNGIVIEESGFNKTEGNPIIVGQKE